MMARTVSVLVTNVSLALSNVPTTSYVLSQYCERKGEGVVYYCGRPLLSPPKSLFEKAEYI